MASNKQEGNVGKRISLSGFSARQTFPLESYVIRPPAFGPAVIKY